MGNDSNETPEGHKESGGSQVNEDKENLVAKLTKQSRKNSIGIIAKLRNYLLTGLIVVGPMLITLYAAWWFIDFIDSWVQPYLPSLFKPEAWIQDFFIQNFNIKLPEFYVPGVGLFVAIFILMFIGALTANLFGRTLISYGELIMSRMPVVRNVYSALKQIFETVLTSSGNSFQTVGLIEYPRPGLYAIVFISKETEGEIGNHKDDAGDKLLSVFLPTTPNPTSGFLLFVPRKDIKILDMTVEEAAKLVISAGLVEPGVSSSKPETENNILKQLEEKELRDRNNMLTTKAAE